MVGPQTGNRELESRLLEVLRASAEEEWSFRIWTFAKPLKPLAPGEQINEFEGVARRTFYKRRREATYENDVCRRRSDRVARP